MLRVPSRSFHTHFFNKCQLRILYIAAKWLGINSTVYLKRINQVENVEGAMLYVETLRRIAMMVFLLLPYYLIFLCFLVDLLFERSRLLALNMAVPIFSLHYIFYQMVQPLKKYLNDLLMLVCSVRIVLWRPYVMNGNVFALNRVRDVLQVATLLIKAPVWVNSYFVEFPYILLFEVVYNIALQYSEVIENLYYNLNDFLRKKANGKLKPTMQVIALENVYVMKLHIETYERETICLADFFHMLFIVRIVMALAGFMEGVKCYRLGIGIAFGQRMAALAIHLPSYILMIFEYLILTNLERGKVLAVENLNTTLIECSSALCKQRSNSLTNYLKQKAQTDYLYTKLDIKEKNTLCHLTASCIVQPMNFLHLLGVLLLFYFSSIQHSLTLLDNYNECNETTAHLFYSVCYCRGLYDLFDSATGLFIQNTTTTDKPEL